MALQVSYHCYSKEHNSTKKYEGTVHTVNRYLSTSRCIYAGLNSKTVLTTTSDAVSLLLYRLDTHACAADIQQDTSIVSIQKILSYLLASYAYRIPVKQACAQTLIVSCT